MVFDIQRDYNSEIRPFGVFFWIAYTNSFSLTLNDGTMYKLYVFGINDHIHKQDMAISVDRHKEIFLTETPLEIIQELIEFYSI